MYASTLFHVVPYFIMSWSISLALMLFCQRIYHLVRHIYAIAIISRNTMFIVGTHFLVYIIITRLFSIEWEAISVVGDVDIICDYGMLYSYC